jgi:hypothetical protein
MSNDMIKQVLAEQELARRNLEYYMRYMFKYKYRKHLKIGWHQGFISEIMMAAFAGDLTRFAISIAPSTGKTEQTVRQGFSWALGKYPSHKYAYTTYGADLSTMVSIQTRSLVESKPYTALFPDTKLSKFKNKNDDWETTQEGGMFATSTGGSMTGYHFDGIMMDDTVKAIEASSRAKHEEAYLFYQGTILTRLKDKERGFIGLVMQRLDINDLVGKIRNSEEGDDWEFFTLKSLEPTTTHYDFGNFHYERPPNEPLFEAHENLEQLEKARRAMGNRNFEAQHQQDPDGSEEGYFDESWINFISEYDIPEERNVYIKIDPATSEKSGADNRAIVVIAYCHKNGYELRVVLNCFYGIWGLYEFVENIFMAMLLYPTATVLIESSGGGSFAKATLMKELGRINLERKNEKKELIKNRVNLLTPPVKYSKMSKIELSLRELENGRIVFSRSCGGMEQIKKEYKRFNPNKPARKNDCIDAISSWEEYCSVPPVKKQSSTSNIRKKSSQTWRF